MAAPTAVEQTMTKRTETSLKPVSTTSQAGESLSPDSWTGQDCLVDFLEKEVGNDLKSLKNVGDLLEKLREENTVLEEQVLTVSSSVPPKVSAALSAAEEALCSLEDLLQRERLTSNMLHQVTASVYQNVLEDFMIPSAEDLYGDADFIFQQYLAPAHTARSTKTWFDAHAITVLDWPANSPDLNPIK
ncbi:hypothetical protein EPR50_G00234530 [Perca flavescens]|uniref:Uncharacterized protein n=1 Tax=Perca flavescens TaxID=8167 RepID=A0A484C0P7_PERFV|nr:hypothetical protein EPR50_G00234530 [Perca flavescens]